MADILSALNLRTHPFRPEKDALGNPFGDPEILLKPLDPASDPRLIDFYFDHYNWKGGIRDISRTNVFVEFPKQTDLERDGPVMILITGSDTSGRKSLRNLILHKIALQFGAPMQVEYSLNGLNAADNIRSIATFFLFTYTQAQQQPTFALLKGPFDLQTGEGDIGSRENYSTLFQLWGRFIQPTYKLPIVLLLDRGDDHDLWRMIYESTSHLFRFIIVLTKDERHALACYNGLSTRNKVLINANLLGPGSARQYLATRLAAERVGAIDVDEDLMPFSETSLNALYEKGNRFKPGDVIEWSIGWLNETFSAVLDDHLTTLQNRLQILEQQGMDLSDVNQDELLIDPETVRAVRNRLYRS